MKLAGRRALVTGGGRGIGRAIVEAFSAEGARTLAVARTAAELERVACDAVRVASIDVTNRADVDRLPALIERELGGLDILVNNAGVWMERSLLEYTREEWDLTLATNLTAVFDVTRAALPALLASGAGRIINKAAIDGEFGYPRLSAQCAAKAGLIGFTRALAKELYDRAITVNAICPGWVDKRTAYADTPERAPGKGPALPWDVARAAVYLASQEGVCVMGACLDVHGVSFVAS
jgi:3-oxoacyl-[acyl-carrier protein] reductase